MAEEMSGQYKDTLNTGFFSVGEYPDEIRGLSWLPVIERSSSLIMRANWIELPVLRFVTKMGK